MENSYIPPEYAAQLAQLQRQKAMAEMLSQRAMAPQGTQVITGHAVKNAPLGNIARALTAFMGNRQAGQMDEKLQGILGQVMQARQQALQGAVANPAQGQASMDPLVRNLAQALVKQRGERSQAGAKILGEAGQTGAALDVLRSDELPGEYKPAPYKSPSLDMLAGPDGKKIPVLTNYDKYGVPKATMNQGTQVSVDARAAGKEGEMALDVLKADIKERQARALAAKETLSSNRVALEALNEGAQAGGMEGFKQALRKIGQGFGLAFDETASTEQLAMGLGNAVLAKARALAPVTAEDVKRLQAILGSVDTDPTALVKMLTVYNGIAAKELQDFNRYLKTQSENLTNPHARDLLSGQGIGFEMQAPPGNTTQSLRAIAELMARGGDPSMFAVGGEPIARDSTFNLPGSGLPEKGAKPQAPIVGLTPQESEELTRLRKKYGR